MGGRPLLFRVVSRGPLMSAASVALPDIFPRNCEILAPLLRPTKKPPTEAGGLTIGASDKIGSDFWGTVRRARLRFLPTPTRLVILSRPKDGEGSQPIQTTNATVSKLVSATSDSVIGKSTLA